MTVTRGPKPKSVEARFWTKVHKTDGCWLWTACCDKKGYGAIGIGSRSDGTRKTELAHRMSFRLANGDIPDAQHVLHRCDNPRCVNPAHLFLGTNDENVADMVAKKRHARGEGHGNAKLTAEQVREIRELHAGGDSQVSLGRRFGVSQPAVCYVVRGVNWREEPYTRSVP